MIATQPAIDGVMALVALVSDPERVKEALVDIGKAQADLDQRAAAVAALEKSAADKLKLAEQMMADSNKRAAAMQKRERELENEAVSLARMRDDMETQKAIAQRSVADESVALKSRMQAIERAQTELDARAAAHAAQMAEREALMNARQKEQDDREYRLNRFEARLREWENELEAARAKVKA